MSGTARGQQSRMKLLKAARTVFERDGYFNASVDDIVKEAGAARGSFYGYFEDKRHVFRIVASEVTEAVRQAVISGSATTGDAVARLHATNLRYLEVYRANAAMFGLVEQVATIDPVVSADRMEIRRQHISRVSDSIARWQERGLVKKDIDADLVAPLLVSMTSNFCYWWFVGSETYEWDRAAETITDTWVRVLGLASPERVRRKRGGSPD
ncbi:MAG: TetR/AcrR family transcriptional regulator [Actinomycetota bacterium]|nr:TetR/AcrR family transcriptional regulator [Actinomycetota bacterium]